MDACSKCCTNADKPSELTFEGESGNKKAKYDMASSSTVARTTGKFGRSDVRDSRTGLPSGATKPVKTRTASMKAQYSTTDVMMIIRVQSLVRGFLQRRRF